MTDPSIPLWLDCDPGHDDALAILLAAYHPRLRLLGISSVFGNASLSHTTANAAAVLTAIGRSKDIPLYQGASRALERPPAHAPEVHGESGLEGTFKLPKPRCAPKDGDAVDAMFQALIAEPRDTAWLVATGSLTNVAVLLRKYPEIVSHLRGISIMGGSFGGGFTDAPPNVVNGEARVGNVGLWAEFNILIDPEAAAEVFHNQEIARKVTLIPLDLSHLVLTTRTVRETVLYGRHGPSTTPSRGKSTMREMFFELLNFVADTYAECFGISEGSPLHDAIAVAAVLIGDKDGIPFQTWQDKASLDLKDEERFQVEVITEGTFEQAKAGHTETGRTIAHLLAPGSEGVRIPRGVDVAKFWVEIEECLVRADKVNEEQGNSIWEEYKAH